MYNNSEGKVFLFGFLLAFISLLIIEVSFYSGKLLQTRMNGYCIAKGYKEATGLEKGKRIKCENRDGFAWVEYNELLK